MKTSFFTIMLLGLFAGTASGQSLTPNAGKPVTFLCPPCGLDCDTVHFEKPGICPVCGMRLFASYPGYENIQGEHHDICNKKVAVVLFPGVEIIDFSGPWEVFGAAGMQVYSVAANDAVVAAEMGLKIKPDYTFANAPVPDIILVPGGNVDISDSLVVNWISTMSKNATHTMSVCTGAFYLAAGGLLDDLEATTNYPAVNALRGLAPRTSVTDTVRFIDNGHIITSAGLSSGIDAAFHLVSLYLGKAQTTKLANNLEYDWKDEDPFVRGKLADKYVQDFLNVLTPFDYEMTEYQGDRNKWQVSVRMKPQPDKNALLQLMFIQMEQVSGWAKSDKHNTWTFEDKGKRWLAELHQTQHDGGDFSMTLRVSAL